MGIKHLNKFFRTECEESIKFTSIADLSSKKIAVDISIYLYKYHENLIENIYLMLAIFRDYNIIPIFIFDGKPPAEKKELMQKRREDKKGAETEYNILKNKLAINNDMDEHDKQEIINSMDMLKRKFIYINKEKIEMVKNLIRSYGATYYDAPGEADELCALLVIKNKVWGCLSEDMDMFVYGCTNVIRYLSLLNHTIVIYNTKSILEKLGITQKELREICALSGTDYNCQNDENNNSPTLYKTLKLFKKYMKKRDGNIEFYEWLVNNSEYIEDIELLYKIYDMFDIKNTKLDYFDKIRISNGPIDKTSIKNILCKEGFIFP